MAHLVYLDEPHTALLTELAGDLFAESLTFRLQHTTGAGLLSSALAVPRQPNYRTLQEKVGALQYHLSMNHPFLDGNKRFAVAAMEVFPVLNGAVLIATDEQLVTISLAVANHELSKEELIRFVKRRTLRYGWSVTTELRWLRRLSASDLEDVTSALSSFKRQGEPSTGETLFGRVHEALLSRAP